MSIACDNDIRFRSNCAFENAVVQLVLHDCKASHAGDDGEAAGPEETGSRREADGGSAARDPCGAVRRADDAIDDRIVFGVADEGHDRLEHFQIDVRFDRCDRMEAGS